MVPWSMHGIHRMLSSPDPWDHYYPMLQESTSLHVATNVRLMLSNSTILSRQAESDCPSTIGNNNISSFEKKGEVKPCSPVRNQLRLPCNVLISTLCAIKAEWLCQFPGRKCIRCKTAMHQNQKHLPHVYCWDQGNNYVLDRLWAVPLYKLIYTTSMPHKTNGIFLNCIVDEMWRDYAQYKKFAFKIIRIGNMIRASQNTCSISGSHLKRWGQYHRTDRNLSNVRISMPSFSAVRLENRTAFLP